MDEYCFNCGKNVKVNVTKSNNIGKRENLLCNECLNLLKLKQTKENRIEDVEEKREFEEFKQLSKEQRNLRYDYDNKLRILFEQKEENIEIEFEEFKQLSKKERDIVYGDEFNELRKSLEQKELAELKDLEKGI